MRGRADVVDLDPQVELAHQVVVIEGANRQRSDLTAALPAEPAGEYASIDEFDQSTELGERLVMVLGPTASQAGGLDQVGRLLRTRPDVRVIMVVRTLTTELLHAAIRAGVSDVVLYSSIGKELAGAVRRADRQLPSAPIDLAESFANAGGALGRVTTVFSPKGGAGTSVVATNLAVLLARRGQGLVVLVDLDLQFGDIALMLRLQPNHTLGDVADVIDGLDAQQLRSMLELHTPTKVMVLAAPVEPAFGARVSRSDVLVILDLLRSFAAHVVVDTSSSLDEVGLDVLEHSDEVLLVGDLDIPTVKNLKVVVQALGALDPPLTRFRLVLNRVNKKKSGVSVEDIERTLRVRADAVVPLDKLVPASVNKGLPLALDAPNSGVPRSLAGLVDLIVKGHEGEDS
jgi:pilus assembly protein CpaE